MPTASLEGVEFVEFRAPEEFRADHAEAVGALVSQALLKEVELTPKPGLVDRLNSGAHRDMNLATFHASIAAIAPCFPVFYRIGASTRDLAPEALLVRIRPEGLACEAAMLRAIGNVNTHKGSIFSMGLLCAAAGRLDCDDCLPCRERLCAEVARICSGLVEAELLRGRAPRTAGEKLYQAYGLTGVRGEAASGFSTVRDHALPAFERILARGGDEEEALNEALLYLLAVNHDTNIVHRGGLAGLAYVQSQALNLIEAGGVQSSDFKERMLEFDSDLIARNLSPGGSADLLAVTWFLSRFPSLGLSCR
jgi:triphosphoribosyl-dephospho-CoA synthase